MIRALFCFRLLAPLALVLGAPVVIAVAGVVAATAERGTSLCKVDDASELRRMRGYGAAFVDLPRIPAPKWRAAVAYWGAPASVGCSDTRTIPMLDSTRSKRLAKRSIW